MHAQEAMVSITVYRETEWLHVQISLMLQNSISAYAIQGSKQN